MMLEGVQLKRGVYLGGGRYFGEWVEYGNERLRYNKSGLENGE